MTNLLKTVTVGLVFTLKNLNQAGTISLVGALIALILLSGLVLLAAKSVSFWQEPKVAQNVQNYIPKPESTKIQADSDEPPLKLKSIGVNFEDFKFTKQKLQFNRLFMGFGFVIPGNVSSTQKAKSNPQPTFVVPLGTQVHSLVDGIVAATPTLWSGDTSIQVTKSGKLERWVYETEHVINPKVKVGDVVKAGQIIAEVSNFDKGVPAGFGAVEIGLLHGGGIGPPEHVCPFLYLDDSIKGETFSKMKTLFKSWEEYIGDQTLYDESLLVPGCLTQEPIEG